MAGTTTSGLVKVIITGDAKQLLATVATVKKQFKDFSVQVENLPPATTSAFKKMEAGLKGVANVATKVTNTLLSMRAIFGMLAIGTVGKSILDIGIRFNKWEASLSAIVGSSQEVYRVQDLLLQQAERLGQNYLILTEQYTKFRGAAEMAGMSIENIDKLFNSTTQASAVFQLSSKDTYEVFRALTQMLQKGTISAEELRGQFGERIPGALAIMANSLDVSLSRLLAMMEGGELMAGTVLPQLAEGMENAFGSKVYKVLRTVQAEMNRFQNAWQKLANEIAIGGAMNTFVEMINKLNETMSDPAFQKSASEIASGIMKIGQALLWIADVFTYLPREVIGLIFGVIAGAYFGPVGMAVGGGIGFFGALSTRIWGTSDAVTTLKAELQDLEKQIKSAEYYSVPGGGKSSFFNEILGGDTGTSESNRNIEELKKRAAVVRSTLDTIRPDWADEGSIDPLQQLRIEERDIREEIEKMHMEYQEERKLFDLRKALKKQMSQYEAREGIVSPEAQSVLAAQIDYTRVLILEQEKSLEISRKRDADRRINLERATTTKLLQITSSYYQAIGDDLTASLVKTKEGYDKQMIDLEAMLDKQELDISQFNKAKMELEMTYEANVDRINAEHEEKKAAARAKELADLYKIYQIRLSFEKQITDIQNRRLGIFDDEFARRQALNEQVAQFAQSMTESGLYTIDQVTQMTSRFQEELEKLSAEERWHRISSFITDALVDPLLQAIQGTIKLKEAFKQMAISITQDLARMAMQRAFMAFFGSLSPGTAAGGSWMDAFVPNKDGGVIQKHAAGGIVSKPTIFPMASGFGLMGEAGPEAIMPLKRGRDGKLGVAGGGGINLTNNIIVQNGGELAQDDEKLKRFTTMIGEEVRNQVRIVMVDERRVNGIFNSSAIRRMA